jgi:hypothetical protein
MELKINHDQRFRDLLNFNWFHFRKSKSARRNRLFLIIFFSILWILIFKDGLTVILTLLIFIPAVYIILPILLPIQLLITIAGAKNKNIIGSMDLLITDEFIIEKTIAGELKCNWESINDIKENNKFYFIYNTPVSAILIPKSKLYLNNISDSFREFINNKKILLKSHK